MTAVPDGTRSFLTDQEHTLAVEVAQLRDTLHAAVELIRERTLELQRVRDRYHRLIAETRSRRPQTRRAA